MISIKTLEPNVKIEKIPNFILKVSTHLIYLKDIIGVIKLM